MDRIENRVPPGVWLGSISHLWTWEECGRGLGHLLEPLGAGGDRKESLLGPSVAGAHCSTHLLLPLSQERAGSEKVSI